MLRKDKKPKQMNFIHKTQTKGKAILFKQQRSTLINKNFIPQKDNKTKEMDMCQLNRLGC